MTENLKNEVIAAATEHLRLQRKRVLNLRTVAYCIAIVLCVLMVCATVIVCNYHNTQANVILEQQYALNAQYAGLLDLLSGAEVTREEYTATADGDESISVAGEGNIAAGGDVIGK